MLLVGRPRGVGLRDRLNKVKDVSVTLEVSNTYFYSIFIDHFLVKELFAEVPLSWALFKLRILA